ncbi:MAG: hypothetical protein QXJ59_09835 [Thermofilaceae archaeon]
MPERTFWGEFPTHIDRERFNKILEKYDVFSKREGSLVQRYAKPWYEYVTSVIEDCDKYAERLERYASEMEGLFEKYLTSTMEEREQVRRRVRSMGRSVSSIVSRMAHLGCLQKGVPYEKVRRKLYRDLSEGIMGVVPEAVSDVRRIIRMWKSNKAGMLKYLDEIVTRARAEGVEL